MKVGVMISGNSEERAIHHDLSPLVCGSWFDTVRLAFSARHIKDGSVSERTRRSRRKN